MIWAFAAVLSLSSTAHAQMGPIQGVTTSANGLPRGGVNVAVCATLTTTGASVTNNVATLTFATNPTTAGFVAAATLTVSGFTGGDTFFNGSFTISATSSTTISFPLTHSTASAGTNGTVYQTGSSTQACAPLSTLYTDNTGGTTTPNPFTSDGLGNYLVWAAPAYYRVQLYGTGITTYIYPTGVPCVPANTVNCGVLLNGVNAFSAANTFPSINGILYVGVASGQYASLQAAHDALPSTGGTVFVTATGTPWGAAGTTVLLATKPMHVILDCANSTYSGSGTAITTSSRGVTWDGCGRRGDDVGAAGTTITITNTAANGISNSGNGATFRGFNLIGPGSGTGKGVVNTAGRAEYSELNISSFGSDGWTNDGTATNANSVLVSKVRSSFNGGNGFVTKGSNGQLVGFSEADGSLNTGDGFNIANQLNVFFATNADGNTGYDYHFVSGGTGNKGDIFSNNAGAGPPGGIQFDAGANSNTFTQLGSGGTLLVTSGLGTNNSVWSQAQTTYTSGDNNMTLGLSSGVGAGIRGSSINFQDNNTNKWTVQKTVTNTFAIVNPGIMNRIELVTGAQSDLNAEGTTAVRFNSKNLAATSTGGVEGWSGGASSAKMWQGTSGGLLVDVNAVTPCTNGELALSAGWQSSGAATVTAALGTGQTCSWTITTGTTTAANPTITDTLTNALPTATTVCWMNIYGGTHVAVAGESLRQTTLSATAPIFTANFTPTNTGATYFVTRGCGP